VAAPNQPKQSPAEYARETFRQLSILRIQPTPEAYTKVYNEVAGVTSPSATSSTEPQTIQSELILINLATNLSQAHSDFATVGNRLKSAVEQHNWDECANNLALIVNKLCTPEAQHTTKLTTAKPDIETLARVESTQSVLLKDLLVRTLMLALPNLLVGTPELANEAEMLAGSLKQAVSDQTMQELATKLKNLCFKIEHLPMNGVETRAPTVAISPTVRQNLTENSESTAILLSKLLSLTLSLAVSTLLHNTPELAKISDQLSDEVKSVEAAPDLQSIESRLKTLFLQITLNVEDTTEQLQLLLTLFQLLLENVGNLLDDDNWLRGQVLVIKALIAGHIDHRSLIDATKSLKEVIYKQGELKDCIAQNRVSVKQMMDLFVERLGLFAETTGDYHLKIASYSKQISETSDVSQVNLVLESVMTDTLLVQSETKKSHSLMVEAQKEVRDAETRIRELEQKLAEMSEQVHKDQLTGSLNRRGLDDIFEREAARADRRGTPLCVGLLDLDNFKRINDLHGHSTGDEALMHLVKVVKQTLRSMDVIARYGGEEFVIIMPETTLTDAADTMTRVQRELTRHFFMVGNERLLITFSAGVTIRELHEDQDSVVKRADKAMYAAKKAGKNRVVIADTCDTLE